MKPMILCVDDEKIILNSLEDQINNRFKGEVEIELAEGGEEGLEVLHEMRKEGRDLAIIICDQVMPGLKGDEFLMAAHQLVPETHKILLTGQTSFEAVRRVINHANLYRYFSKPWEEDDLMLTLDEALKSYLQRQQLTESNVYSRLLHMLNKQAREISSEMNIEHLIDKFLNIALDCTHGERGVLILRDQGQFRVVAMSSVGQSAVNRLSSFSDNEIKLLTTHFMDNIDLLLDEQFDNSRQMATRIENKDGNWGFIYLEIIKGEQVFSHYHREMLEMLASQAAISIENARLYNTVRDNAQALLIEKENVEIVKSQLEEANGDLTDSIRYAQRIQKAFLPHTGSLTEIFPDSFTYIKPRDIVSGDFYWWTDNPECTIVAAVDCTGHGVPGALMSIIGANFLNQIVSEYAIYDPEVILSYLDIRVQAALSRSNTDGRPTYDGMDLSICLFDKESRSLKFAGANRPMIVLRNGEIHELAGAKRSIGSNPLDVSAIEFELHNWQLQDGDCIYLFSDGFPDQFGGEQHRKYTYRRFKEDLIQLSLHPMAEQAQLLSMLFSNWQQGYRQTDDVLVIGIRV